MALKGTGNLAPIRTQKMSRKKLFFYFIENIDKLDNATDAIAFKHILQFILMSACCGWWQES